MKLPLHPKDSWEIIDEDGKHICLVVDKPDRDYIIKVVNSHEKLMEACDHAYSFMICVNNLDNNETLKWQENVTEELKQSLKEVVKQ